MPAITVDSAYKARLAVLVSGGGSNLQAVLDACGAGELNAEVAAVISSNPAAFALTRAEKAGVPAYTYSIKDYGGADKRNAAMLNKLKEINPDLIILAGYLGIIPPEMVRAFPGGIINIHPSLLPEFGGAGMYGLKVHEAVIAAGAERSGATVHFVDEGTDTGKIILQRSLPVLKSDTPESLQARILEQIEHPLLVEAVKLLLGTIYIY